MKNIRLKLLLSVLILFSYTFFFSIKETKAIYKEVKSTTVSLTIIDNPGYTVTFVTNGGGTVPSRNIEANQPVGTLPILTKTDYNFAGWYDQNNQPVKYDTLITGDTTLTARWQKIVCKKVTLDSHLHTETCAQTGNAGCNINGTGLGTNATITYGSTLKNENPTAGSAYDCDVDYDTNFDLKDQYDVRYTERFYFVREKVNSGSENTAVLFFYTSIDANGRVDRTQGTNDVGSYVYNTALTYLPTTDQNSLLVWDNPDLVDFDGQGATSRFLTIEDVEAVCGSPFVASQNSYFINCGKWFFFENSRFQSNNLSRAGIWLQKYNNNSYRIQTSAVTITTGTENMTRPAIEIPMTALEGYYDEDLFTISFVTYDGDPNTIDSENRFRGQTIGTLPTPTRPHYTFSNWCTDSGCQNAVDPNALVSGNMTLYANWEEIPPLEVTLVLNGGTLDGFSNPILVQEGETIDPWPVPTYDGKDFMGWYKDAEMTSQPFIESDIVDTNITLHAKWQNNSYVAKIGNTLYTSLASAINDVPTGNVKTTIKIINNISLASAVSIPSGKYVELDIGEYTITGIGNLISNSGTLDIINGTIDCNGTANDIYAINNAQNATLNIKGGLLASSNATGTRNTIVNAGTINITGGRLQDDSQGAVINNNKYGVINMSAGEIIGTNTVMKNQAIYNKQGTINISGTAYLENASINDSTNGRAAVHLASGTLTMTGGTIVSKNYMAVKIDGGTATIGINDNNGNVIDTTTPVLQSAEVALNRTGGTVNVYDGVFKTSKSGATSAVTGTITKPSGTEFDNSSSETIDNETYLVTYLKLSSGGPYTVTFNKDNGEPNTIISNIASMDTLGSSMPANPTKNGYMFIKWYISVNDAGTFTSSTPIVNDITVMAKWKPAIGSATISPASITLALTETDNITVSGPADMEDYTFSSSNTSVATVDSNGLVTGVGAGNATITITGTESHDTVTINVTVGSTPPVVYHTVTFYKELNGQVVHSVQVEDGTQIGAANMPQSNPTKTNYVFDNWYVNGATNTPAFNASATITGDVDVIANWFESVDYATLVISPDPMVLNINGTGTITLNPTVFGDTVESYTCTSSNDNVATVNNCTVTAVDAGNATITVMGSDQQNPKTVNVTVNAVIVYHTVNFYKESNGQVVHTVQVEHGTQIGAANMPQNNPTKTNYVFDNWYVNGATNTPAFNSNAVITADVDVIANWFESVDYATLVINPDPMVLDIGDTGTITLNPTVSGDTVESYTCTSSNDNVATVNNCTVTAVDAGNATITITGSDQQNPKTVSVTVNPITYTVKFDKNNGDTVVTINNVAYGTLLSTLVPANPTKSNYTFDDWYLVDNGTWTLDPIDTSISVTEDLEYKAGFYSANDVAAIGPNYYTLLSDTFNAIGTGNIPSTVDVRILKDFTVPTKNNQNRPAVTSGKEATIYGNGHTITCGNNNIIWVNGGTVTIRDITLTCAANKTAPIDNAGTITVIDSTLEMTLTGTNGRAAIYNTGTVNVYGNSTLLSNAKDRPTLQNVSSGARINVYGGTITQGATDATESAVKVVSGSYGTITGGTITSVHLHGVYNEGTLVIGTKDDQYSTTSIVITGEGYGINSTANYSLYDGLIKGKTNSQAVNDFSKITGIEDNSVRATGTDGSYYTLYYTLPTPTPTPTTTPNQLTINFDAIGVTNPSSQQVNEGSPIGTLPTVSWGNKTFDGWYTDTTYTTQVTTSTVPTVDGTTYYAKWTYTGSKVTYDSTNDAMDEYFDNISTWKNQNESTFATTMLTNFNNNNCSNCNAANGCDNPLAGDFCDKPKEYNTNVNAQLDVYLYDESSHTILSKVDYASLTNGKITNLIPGLTYYWENNSDPSVNGLISATTPRRTIDAGNVRNVRDLGGLSVTYTENNVQKTGTIKYGRLLRGAKLSSSEADVTALTSLGITREIDLRPSNEGSGQAKLPVLDNGTGTDIVIHNYLINNTAITYSYKDKNGANQSEVPAYTSYAQELKSALRSTMQHIINGDNIYFHCTIGTDRTGTLAYFLEGLLGVSEEDRVEDYELTYFFGLTNRTRYHDYLSGSDINPRFTFMHLTYPTNQDIYDWFVAGDSSSELAADNALITAFRNAMIDN